MNVPARQETHVVKSALLCEPDGQALHDVAPTPEMEPGAQAAQVL